MVSRLQKSRLFVALRLIMRHETHFQAASLQKLPLIPENAMFLSASLLRHRRFAI
jgi:hypothetical protein